MSLYRRKGEAYLGGHSIEGGGGGMSREQWIKHQRYMRELIFKQQNPPKTVFQKALEETRQQPKPKTPRKKTLRDFMP